MKTISHYFICSIISIILICGSDGCSDKSTSPSGSKQNQTSDSLFYQVDSLYAHGVPGFLSYSDTIYSCTFKSVRVTFTASTNDTSNNSNSAGFGIGFEIIRYPINSGTGVYFIGRNINVICDTTINVFDSLSHDLHFGYTLATHNQPYGDTSRYIRVNNLKLYKHS